MTELKQFIYQGKNYTLEVEDGWICSDNDSESLRAYWDYKQELEDIAFRNAPPQKFCFFLVGIEESGDPQLVGASSPEEAIELVSRILAPTKIVSSYEKFCNFASLSEEEFSAQCYASLLTED